MFTFCFFRKANKRRLNRSTIYIIAVHVERYRRPHVTVPHTLCRMNVGSIDLFRCHARPESSLDISTSTGAFVVQTAFHYVILHCTRTTRYTRSDVDYLSYRPRSVRVSHSTATDGYA